MSNIKVYFWAVRRGSRRRVVSPLSKDMTDHKGYKPLESSFTSSLSQFWRSADNCDPLTSKYRSCGDVARDWWLRGEACEGQRYVRCIHSTCCATEICFFALCLRTENCRQHRASWATVAVTFFGTLWHTGLVWRKQAHIFHSQMSACLREVADLNPGTEWPFSADSYAGLRLLGLHEQQASTNMLLTMSNARHKGGRQTVDAYESERQGTNTCTGNMANRASESIKVGIRHLSSQNAKFGALAVSDGLTWWCNVVCAACHSFSLTDGVVNWTTVSAMF